MGREVWIYEVNKIKFLKGLNSVNSNTFGFSQPFFRFLNKDNSSKNQPEKDEQTVSTEILFEITYWLSELVGLTKEQLELFLNNEMGVTTLYESSTKSAANGLMVTMYTYIDILNEKKNTWFISDAGVKTSCARFKAFLAYFILLLDYIKLQFNTDQEYSSRIKSVIAQITKERSGDEAFNFICNLEIARYHKILQLILSDKENRNSLEHWPEYELIIRNNSYIEDAINMYSDLNSTDRDIVVVDSR